MDVLLILMAAFGAGVLNSIAGGGTFLTFPALVFIGVPPILANATSAVVVLPGYFGGALGFRREIGRFEAATLFKLLIVTFIGGLIGSLLLLVSTDQAFSFVVPFLLLAATMVFLFGDQIRTWAARKSRTVTPFGTMGLLLVSIYGGYFNGGLGIILLALFALWGLVDIHEMNGLKIGLSFALSAVSVAVFAASGLVVWQHAIGMMVASTVGGYAGAPISRLLPKSFVRGLIALVGLTMSAVFFWRLLA
jgi:uncharacterized membrane protein YfcA